MSWLLLIVGVVVLFLLLPSRPITRAVRAKPTEPRTIAPADDLPEIDTRVRGELEEAIRRQYRKTDAYYRLRMASGEVFAVGFTEGEPWLDVFTRKRRKGEKGGVYTGPYDDFGYDALDGRWSYGESPPRAAEIRELIARSFGAKQRGRWS